MGIVIEVGANVKDFKLGDHVGVGCMVGSCGECEACANKVEQFCKRIVWTYGSVDMDGSPTYGGYSNVIVVNHK